jgi:hypothetical protein
MVVPLSLLLLLLLFGLRSILDSGVGSSGFVIVDGNFKRHYQITLTREMIVVGFAVSSTCLRQVG